MDFLIILLLAFAVMWLLVVLPQRRRHAAHERLVESIDEGDEVVTAGGLYGTVKRVHDEELGLEIADGVEVRVAKQAIAAVVSQDEGADTAQVEETPS